MNKREQRSQVMRDIALVLLLLWAFAQAVLMVYTPEGRRAGYLALLFAVDAAVLLGYMGRPSLSVACNGTLTCVWVSITVYNYFVKGTLLAATDYWITLMPLVGALSGGLYQYGLASLKSENLVLRKRVEELVLVDENTGLYNLRALYRDLWMMVCYSTRNHWPISLMIIQIRYETEYRHMLSKGRYYDFLHRFVTAVGHSVRVEDRVYSIDEHGTVAVILTTDEPGARIVAARIRAGVAEAGLFEGLLDDGIQLDLRIAAKQYQKKYGKDMQKYKNDVENELVYDV